MYGGIVLSSVYGSYYYDHYLYEFDPSSRTWAAPVPFGNPCRPHRDFHFIHTGLGTSNNILRLGGHVVGEAVAGFVR